MAKARIEATLTDVGTDFVVATVTNEPAAYRILRARAKVISGTASSVALRVTEDNTESIADIALEYELTSGSIDATEADEEILFFAKDRSSTNVSLGNTYIAVKCDTSGNTVNVKLDVLIEA